ncbi:MAG: anthranilate phosphoribosyltransferase [Gemmatimonadales bacterium]
MKELLERILDGTDLNRAEAERLLETLASGTVAPELIGGTLTGLRAKGESADEIAGFANAMRRLAVRPDLSAESAIDIVGTGGDGSGSVNISTGAALLTAACGLPVIKHGNRSISSRCGSADVLAQLGLNLPLDEQQAGRCLARTGFTFLFAPHYHPAMAAIAPVRRSLGIRTVFNILGPLTNPAEPSYNLIGAYAEPVAELMAHALSRLNIVRAFVVHGAEGWDEATPVGPFVIYDVTPNRVTRHVRSPESYGVPPCATSDLLGDDAKHNAAALADVFNGAAGPHRDTLLINTSLALEVAGYVNGPREGVDVARRAVDSGAASTLLTRLKDFGSSEAPDV